MNAGRDWKPRAHAVRGFLARRYARAMSGLPVTLADLECDALTGEWRAFCDWDGSGKFDSWAFKGVLCELRDRWRHERSRGMRYIPDYYRKTGAVEVADVDPNMRDHSDPEAEAVARAFIEKALAVLTDEQRAAVVAVYLGGMRPVEYARMSGVDPRNVYKLIDRAFARIRRTLNQEEDE